MRRSEMRWSEVRVGLFVAMVLALVFGLVIYMGIAGLPFREFNHFQVRATGGVSGFAEGSPVELGGVYVGQVERVRPPTVEQPAALLDVKVGEHAFRQLGHESQVHLLARSLIGQRYVQLSPRPPGTPGLQDGETVDAMPVVDLEALVAMFGDTLLEMREASSDVSAMVAEVGAGQGALGRLIRDPELAGALDSAIRGFAEVSTALSEGQGSLGRLLRDPTAARQLESALADLAAFTKKLESGESALGALTSDPEVAARLRRSLIGLERLLEDIRRHPERYVNVKVF